MRGKNYRIELRSRIIEAATTLFRQHGIKRVTMDDVAHSLGISKRTLYEVFREKEALVVECLKLHHQQFLQKAEDFQQQNNNVLETTLQTLHYALKQYSETSKAFFDDVDIYPQVKELIQKDRERKREASMEYFELGVKQGIFNADLNYEIIALLNDSLSKMLIENSALKSFPLSEVVETILMTFLRGIVTEKGRIILDSFYKEHHQK